MLGSEARTDPLRHQALITNSQPHPSCLIRGEILRIRNDKDLKIRTRTISNVALAGLNGKGYDAKLGNLVTLAAHEFLRTSPSMLMRLHSSFINFFDSNDITKSSEFRHVSEWLEMDADKGALYILRSLLKESQEYSIIKGIIGEEEIPERYMLLDIYSRLRSDKRVFQAIGINTLDIYKFMKVNSARFDHLNVSEEKLKSTILMCEAFSEMVEEGISSFNVHKN